MTRGRVFGGRRVVSLGEQLAETIGHLDAYGLLARLEPEDRAKKPLLGEVLSFNRRHATPREGLGKVTQRRRSIVRLVKAVDRDLRRIRIAPAEDGCSPTPLQPGCRVYHGGALLGGDWGQQRSPALQRLAPSARAS